MSTISELLTNVEVIHQLHEQQKKAEKARVAILHAEAVSLFKTCYAQYNTLQSLLHSTLLSQRDHPELSTSLAEAALYVNEIAIARLLVERFLQLATPKDQFYCRIRIIFGLIIYAENRSTNGSERIVQCKKAVNQVLQALEVATTPSNLSRYKFIVYNTSLAFWQITREFIRSGRGSHFANEINTVIAALEGQDDSDITWRMLLLSAGAICADDEKNIKNATDYVDKAITHLEQLLSVTLAEEAAMDRIANNVKNDVDNAMNAFRLIEERQVLMNKPRKIDPDLPDDDPYYTTPLTFPPLTGLAANGREHVKTLLDIAQKKKAEIESKLRVITDRKRSQSEYQLRLYRQRIAVNAVDSKKILTLPQVIKDIRLLSMITIQCLLTPNAIPEKEVDSTWTTLVKKLTDAPPSEARSETLLDISRMAWQVKQYSHAQRCMEVMQSAPTNISRILRAKLDICEALRGIYLIDTETQEVANNKQLFSTKEMEGLRITKRMEAVKLLERTLSTNVAVIEDKFLVQEMCILLYNMLIPLLSSRHRHRAHSVLRVISTAMDEIDLDALPILRSQVQYELALCEESADFADIALVEVQKAYAQDYGDVKQPVSIADTDALNLNRLSDQFLFPFLQSLSLRIDVYANPSEAENQVLLWLQQAKESSSRLFIKDMITKSASLLFEEIETAKAAMSTKSDDNGSVIDWSLTIMKKGKIHISEVTLPELEAVFTPDYAAPQSAFSYSQQKYIQLLVTLAKLAFSIEESVILNRAFIKIMQFKWQVSEPYAYEFIDDQIDIYCKFAESVPWMIQKLLPSRSAANDEVDSVAYALGTITKDTSENMASYKKLAVKALDSALQLAISRKDSFLVYNVLIYFWNLHVHVFRGNYYVVMLEEVFTFVKSAVIAIQSELLSFANIQQCCDSRLLLNYIETLASMFESRNMMSEALDTAVKGVNLVIPTLPSASSTACYFKKNVIEKASRLSVNMVIAANSGANTDANAKGGAAKKAGGGKGDISATGSLEPMVVADNPWLSLFAAITIAEFYPGSVPTLPKEALLSCIDKANKLLLNEVKQMLDKEVDSENKNTILRTKESFDQRLEMQLECHARLSRMKILQQDYIAAQDLAEAAIAFFQDEQLRVYSRRVDNLRDKLLTSRTFRWMGCVEQYMSLAIISFLETAATLHPTLVTELQFAALTHLQPAIAFSSWAKEELLLTQVTSLVVPMLDNLLSHVTFFRPALHLCYDMITELVSVSRSKPCQRVYRALYLSMTQALIAKQSYDEALKLILQAFDKLDNDLTKDLWPARVVCMSKKGMNVLDGLQKLKESDPLLQAQVLVLFARSSKSIANKLSVYQQVVELLDKRIERVDYLLELAEVLSSHGFPRAEIKVMLQDGFATLCSVEENRYEDIADWEEGDDLPVDATAVGGNTTAVVARAASTTSKSIRHPASVSNNNKGKSSGASVAMSNKAGSNKANSIKNGGSISKTRLSTQPEQSMIEDDPMVKILNFHTLELAYRTCIMKSRLCVEQEEIIKELLMSVYFIHRSYTHWLTTLQTAYKQDEYSKLQLAKSEKVDFNSQQYLEFSPENMPAFLVNIEIHLRELCVNDAVTVDEEIMKMTLKKCEQFSEDLPSFVSLNNFNATIYQLFLLFDQLLGCDLCYEALFVLKYTRLLLWSFPSTQQVGMTSRNIALLALSLRYRDFISTFNDMTFSNEKFLFEVNATTEEVVFLQEGEFLNNFLQTLHAKHINPSDDITASLQYDLTFVDMLLTKEKASFQEQQQQPFQIEITNQTFTSLLELEVSVYWIEVLKGLRKNSSFVICEMLTRVLLWEVRFLPQAKSFFFAQISSFILESLLLKGEYQEVIVQVLTRKNLLLTCGDVPLMYNYFRALMIAYERSEQVEEALQIGSMLQALLEDLSCREVNRTQDGNVTIKSILFDNDENDGGNDGLKVRMDVSLSGAISGMFSKDTLNTKNTRNTKNASSKSYSTKEISKEVLHIWTQNTTYLAHLTLKSGLLKLQRQSNKNVDSFSPLENYEKACFQLNQNIEILTRIFGKMSFQVLEVVEMKMNFILRFLEEFQRKYSRYFHDEKAYLSWYNGVLMECIEGAKMMVESRLFWYERSLSQQQAEEKGDVEVPISAATQAATAASSEPQILTFGQVPPPSPVPTIITEEKAPVKPVKGTEIKVEKTEVRATVKSFPSVQQHRLGQAQLLLAFVQFYHAFMTHQHVMLQTDENVEKSETVIDRYLVDTEEHRLDDKSFFQVGIWPQIIALTEKAMCNMTYVNGDDSSSSSGKSSELLMMTEMLSLAAQLANNFTATNLDSMNFNISKLTSLLTTNFNLPFPRSAESGKTSYINPDCSGYTISMDQGLSGYLSRVTRSCVAGVLMECHGRYKQTWKFAEMNFLLQAGNMHSLYLEKIWKSSLNPKCSVSVALARCEQSQGISGFGNEAKEKESVRVEREFLKTVSVPVRRLNVIGETATALSTVEGGVAPRPPMAYLTLSLAPDGSCLYLSTGFYGTKAELDTLSATASHVAAGGKGAAPPAAAPAKKGDPASVPIEGKKVDDSCWLAHRLILTESDRRAIQLLIAQHQQWIVDAQKFVANYGDNLTEADELESLASTLNVPRTTSMKAERALDETFKANLGEMTRIFTPIALELTSFSLVFGLSVAWGLQIFIDPHLQSLPWEAFLSSLSLPFGHRICRDFSLSLLAHRVATMDNTMAVQASSLRHAIDPFDEDSLGVSNPPRPACRVAFESQLLPSLPGGNKWQRLGRGKLTPTLEDLSLALDAAPAPNKAISLFMQPLGRLSSFLPLIEAASGAVQGSGKGSLKLLISLEAGHNEMSFRRQNSGDVLKTIGEIEREGPGSLALPALLSLTGVGSIATMQWSTPIVTQQRQMQQLLKQWAAPAKKERLLSVFGDPAVMSHNPPAQKVGANTAAATPKKGKELPIVSAVTAAGAVTLGGGEVEEKKRVKKWIAAARVLYGVANLTYTDA